MIIITFVVGMFVGWNMPQPQYAKNLQVKFVAWFNKKSA